MRGVWKQIGFLLALVFLVVWAGVMYMSPAQTSAVTPEEKTWSYYSGAGDVKTTYVRCRVADARNPLILIQVARPGEPAARYAFAIPRDGWTPRDGDSCIAEMVTASLRAQDSIGTHDIRFFIIGRLEQAPPITPLAEAR